MSLNYRPFEHVSLFAHWAKAYRSGGFNAFAYRGSVESELVYDSESATEWGIDAKTTLLDGRARLNVSLYRMDVEDFQVLSRKRLFILPIEFPDTINAPKARAQGIEADLTWLATDWLTIIGTVGFNDTEYLDFPFNDCARGKENTDGDADPRCDVTGRPFWAAPQWNNTLTASVFFPLSEMPAIGGELPSYLAEVAWTASATMEYTDVYYPDWDLDIRKRQRAFFRWRGELWLRQRPARLVAESHRREPDERVGRARRARLPRRLLRQHSRRVADRVRAVSLGLLAQRQAQSNGHSLFR